MARVELNIVALGDFKSVNAEISNLKKQVDSLNKSLVGVGLGSTLIKDLNAANAAFKATMLSTGQFTEHTVKLTSETEKFGQQLASGKLKLSEYFNIIKNKSSEATASMKALAIEQTKLQNSIVMADPAKKGVFSVYTPSQIDMVANKTKIATNMQNIYNIAVDKGSQSLINWGKNTQWAGRQLTVGLTVPMAMFGRSSMQIFQQVNDELVRLQKVYGTGLSQPTQAALAAIKKDVIGLSRELASTMGVSARDTAAMAADIAATGKTGNDLLVATREAMRLSKLGELDQQQAMQATVSLQNVYKLSTQDLSKSIDFLNAVENQTSTSLQDLVDGIPRVGPIVQQLGGSFKDTAVMMVAMKEAGVPAAQSANAIKSALASLINPTKNAKEAFAAYNIDLASIATKTGGNPIKMIMALQDSLKGLDKLAQAQLIEKLFGKFQQARIQALITNLGSVNSQTKTAFGLVNASAPQLAALAANEMKIATESTTGKFKRAVETLKADLIPLGESIMKVATVLLQFGNSIANAFTSLPGPVKTVMSILAGAAALVGPIVMLIGLMGNFAGYIMKTVFNLKNLIAGTKTFGELFTPEMIASQNAADLFSNKILEDASSVELLNTAVKQLITSLELMNVSMGGQAIGGLPVINNAGYERAHLTGNMDLNSPAAIAAIEKAGLTEFSKTYKVAVVSNLVAELPALINQRLRNSGARIEEFSSAWFGRTGKMYGSAMMGGGKDILDNPTTKLAVDKLEAEIGNRAIVLARGTANQKVTDPILAQATQEVIAKYKILSGAEAKAALAFEAAGNQIGQVRRYLSKAEIEAGLANGILTKKGKNIFMGNVEVAREKNGGGWRPGSSYNMPDGYASSKFRKWFGIPSNQKNEIESIVAQDTAQAISSGAEIGMQQAVTTVNPAKLSRFKGLLKSPMAGGMALMAGSMAANAILPDKGAGGVARGAISAASTGAMMGSFIPGVGTAVGAGIGASLFAATKGISALIESEKNHAAAAKASFQSSTTDVQFFGDKVIDTSLKIRAMEKPIKEVTNKFGQLNPELQSFVNYVDGLDKKDPTKVFVNNLKGLDSISAITGEIRSKVATAISTGGLDPKNAEKYVAGLLAAAGKTKQFANVWKSVAKDLSTVGNATTASFNKLATAASKSGYGFYSNSAYANGALKSYSELTIVQKALADQMLNMFSITSNGSLTLGQIKERVAALGKSSISSAVGVNALTIAIRNSGDKNAIDRLDKIKSYYKDAGDEAQLSAGKIMMANYALQVTSEESMKQWASKNGMRKSSMKDIIEKYTTSSDFKKASKEYQSAMNAILDSGTSTSGDGKNSGGINFVENTAMKAAKKALEEKISAQSKYKKALDDEIKAQQKITEEMKRQQDFQLQKTDLQNQIRMAQASGNFLQANLLRQQLYAAQSDFSNQSILAPKEQASQNMQNMLDLYQTALAKLNTNTANNSNAIPKDVTSVISKNPVTETSATPSATQTTSQSTASSAITAGSIPKSYSSYIIKSGDSLGKIAAAYGITKADLLAANKFLTTNAKYQNGAIIFAGGTLKIPKFHSGIDSVPGAAGQEVLALLQAGERVIPASQNNGTMGNAEYNINVNVAGSNATADEIAKTVLSAIKRQNDSVYTNRRVTI